MEPSNLLISNPLLCGNAVFLTDFFRCPINGMSSPTSNRKLMINLFKSTLIRLGWNCSEVFPIEDGGTIDTIKIMEYLNLPLDCSGWAAATSSILTEDIDKYIDKSLLEANLVVTYGLTPAIASLLNRYHIPYIDIEVSPIRFCSDLFLYVRSNHFAINQAIEAIEIDDEYFWNEASILSSALAWRGVRYYENPLKKYGVFIGQSPIDLALVNGGRISEPIFHSEFIRNYFSNVDEIIFSPHPYDNDGIGLTKIKSVIPSISITNYNTYKLLCCENVVNVLALSSSVINEAKYFLKKADKLISPDRDKCSTWFNTGSDVASIDFWRFAMNLGQKPSKITRLPRNLSDVFNVRWGMDKLL